MISFIRIAADLGDRRPVSRRMATLRGTPWPQHRQIYPFRRWAGEAQACPARTAQVGGCCRSMPAIRYASAVIVRPAAYIAQVQGSSSSSVGSRCTPITRPGTRPAKFRVPPGRSTRPQRTAAATRPPATFGRPAVGDLAGQVAQHRYGRAS